MTQRDDVLRMLENAGERGVTTGEFLEAKVPRFSARIEELRRTHVIVKHRVTASRYRYELVGVDDSGWMVGAVESIPGAPGAAGTSDPQDETVSISQQGFLTPAGGRPSSQSLFDDDGEPAVMPAMYRDAA